MKSHDQDMLLLSGYIDNKLDQEQNAIVEHRLSFDGAFLEMFETLRQQKVSARCEKPVAEHLKACLYECSGASIESQSSSSLQAAGWMYRLGLLDDGFSLRAAYPGVAAVLFLVLLITLSLLPRSIEQSIVISSDVQSQLSRITAGSRFNSEIGEVHEVSAFRRANGALCKQLRISALESYDVVVCRSRHSWIVRAKAIVSNDSCALESGCPSGNGATAGIIDAYVRKSMVGSALTKAQEEELLFSGR